MQRVVLDTNVLVSAIIQRSYPYHIVNEFFIERKIELCISNELMQEYYEVLKRDKFSRYPDFSAKAEFFLSIIETEGKKYFPKRKLRLISDESDNKLLELAGACKANFLVTGNTTDFTLKKYKQTFIVTPREYWEKHRP